MSDRKAPGHRVSATSALMPILDSASAFVSLVGLSIVLGTVAMTMM